jgi:hypothetical protein
VLLFAALCSKRCQNHIRENVAKSTRSDHRNVYLTRFFGSLMPGFPFPIPWNATGLTINPSPLKWWNKTSSVSTV